MVLRRRLLRLGLAGTDERVRADKSVTPTFLFARAALAGDQACLSASSPQPGRSKSQQMIAACEQVTARQQSRIAIPKRFTLPMREIIGMQPRFETRAGRRALRLLEHPRFRAAYDFLLLRAAAGEVDPELATWWTEIQSLPAEERIARVEQRAPGAAARHASGVRRRRRRRRRAPCPRRS